MTARRRISQGSFEAEIGYARAVGGGERLLVSGTTGFDYAGMTISPDVVARCRKALANIADALSKAGVSFADVVRVHYYVSIRAK